MHQPGGYPVYYPDPRMGDPSQARGRQEREAAPVRFTEGKLFIGGVDASLISREELVQYCSQWGEVADAVVMDRKGYGFVTFADPKNAMAFLEKREHELKGRRLDAKASVPKVHLGTAKLTKKMFVGGTGELTDQDFRDHFGQYGDIEDAAVVRREGQSRGFGFVTFRDEISVEKCLLVNHFIKGRKVELKRAVPKDEVLAAQGVPAPMGYPPGAPYGPPHPGMMQQQFYPMAYGPNPAAYGMRPGFPPSPAGMPMAADPYGWYGMGYMPYFPAAGMYPPPYGMLPPQPGMPAPYGAVAGPYMPTPGGMPGPRGYPQQQQQLGPGSSGPGGGHEAGSSSRGSRGGNNRGGAAGSSAEAGTGGSQRQQQQQQHEEPHAASPAGPASSSGGPPGVGRAASDPAAAGSSKAAAGGSSGGSSSAGPPGLAAASGSPLPAAAAAAPAAGGRPGMAPWLRPAGGPPGAQRGAMGPGVLPHAAAAGMPPGAGAGAALGGFSPHRGAVVLSGPPPQQAPEGRRQQQQPQQQQQGQQ